MQAEIEKSRKTCAPETAVFAPGFMQQKDVNGDGVEDFILDYAHFVCGGSSTYFCGSAGCLAQVFVSLPDGSYLKALDENVRSLRFATVKGRPAMIIGSMAALAARWALHIAV